ncbi:hypothetical protein DNTS_004957 [Danionella cerebrum]|uniref:AIG1-type G domain-containing protein n=1 Tax=Danionella cerebrum TaxID=2873325 RepID=A0A553PW15_9TELE|nr:hypothetical protein DNTS_004957 [Danionella translucida]
MGAAYSHPEIRIVLLGKTGDGKSSAGNTILNEEIFQSKASPESVTTVCISGDRKINGKTITVIDTPGLFDTGDIEETIKSEIVRSVIESSPGPDMFIIVLKVGRYTGQEMDIVNKIVEYCGEDTFNHSVVLFTHGEQLEGQTIEEFVKMSPKLQELVDKCGGRCHVIDSIYWKKRQLGHRSNRVQVKMLLETIEKMRKHNNSGIYSNELLQIVEEEIQEEIKNVTDTNLSNEAKREIAKKIVHKKLLIRLAGVATGTLTGAFLGIGVAVATVVTLLQAATVAGVTAAGAAGVTRAAGIMGVATGTAVLEAGLVTAASVAGIGAGAAGIGAGAAGIGAGAAGIGVAAGSGIAAGLVIGAAALGGAIGGGVTGCKAADKSDSVCDVIKNTAKLNYENAKGVVKKANEQQNKLLRMKQNYSELLTSVPESQRRIVLLGNAGHGKSSTGNTILRENLFEPKTSTLSPRAGCQSETRRISGRKLTVIDTPGDELTESDSIECLVECAPAIDAFILVINFERYKTDENEVVPRLLNTFKDEEALKHTVIVFTFGEQHEGKTFRKSPKLQELVDKCGGRFHVIDNKCWRNRKWGKRSNKVQVKNLLETIDGMVRENGPYSNELLQKAEELIQQELKDMTKNENPEEKREEAKKLVHGKIMEQLNKASTETGASTAGVITAVTSVWSLVQSFFKLKARFTALGLGDTGSSLAAAGVVGVSALSGGLAAGILGSTVSKESESVYGLAKAASIW